MQPKELLHAWRDPTRELTDVELESLAIGLSKGIAQHDDDELLVGALHFFDEYLVDNHPRHVEPVILQAVNAVANANLADRSILAQAILASRFNRADVIPVLVQAVLDDTDVGFYECLAGLLELARSGNRNAAGALGHMIVDGDVGEHVKKTLGIMLLRTYPGVILGSVGSY